MNPSPQDINAVLLRLLGDIAPEADLGGLDPRVNLRDQLDIDSMDFLNYVIAIDSELGIEVPENDYPALLTLGGGVRYLVERLQRKSDRASAG